MVRVEQPWLPPAKGRRRTLGGTVLRALRIAGWTVAVLALVLAAVWLWSEGVP